jgi:HTH-type transcriptional regulator/antitoxin HigA
MNDPVVAPIPAGQFLGAEIEARGWTQADFASVIGRPTQFVSEIITGKKEITRESAAQIGAALGTTPKFWLNLQDAYLLDEQARNSSTQHELDQVRRRARLNKLAPVSTLVKRGIIQGRTLDEQEAELKELFELDDINKEPAFVLAAKRSNRFEELSAAQMTWVACIRREARAGTARASFATEKLAHLAAELPRIVTTPEKFRDLPSLFGEVGVLLVHVEAFPGAKIDGCAFFFDGTPIIGLSGRGKRIDKVLFTLLHESAHLALGHVKQDGIIVEEVEQQAHESANEMAANNQAGSWILPQPLPYSRERINHAWITRTAKERGLAPIVVVGQLQNLRRLDWRSTLARSAPTVTTELSSW